MSFIKVLVLIALVIAFGVAPAAASAKACVRIEVAPVAAAGQPVWATVWTFMPRWWDGKVIGLVPMAWPLGRLMLTAQGPQGRWFEVPSWKTATRHARVARIVFPIAGAWRLTATNWASAPPSCAPPARVLVSTP